MFIPLDLAISSILSLITDLMRFLIRFLHSTIDTQYAVMVLSLCAIYWYYIVAHRKGKCAMRDLWGEETQPRPKKRPVVPKPAISLTSQDCLFFGHTWQAVGMQGEKQCVLCHIQGFCPGCMPIAPRSAIPFYCARHTPESGVQA